MKANLEASESEITAMADALRTTRSIVHCHRHVVGRGRRERVMRAEGGGVGAEGRVERDGR